MSEVITVPTIMKVTIEYGDRYMVVEGEQAELWLSMTRAQATIAGLHGYQAPGLMWTRINKDVDVSENEEDDFVDL